jgi:hypothetical protein
MRFSSCLEHRSQWLRDVVPSLSDCILPPSRLQDGGFVILCPTTIN